MLPLLATLTNAAATARGSPRLLAGSSSGIADAGHGPVFFLGLQKDGTSSFASFMANLGYSSMHGWFGGWGWGYGNWDPTGYAKDWHLCAAKPPSKLMDHNAFVLEMAPALRAVLAKFLQRTERASFAGHGPGVSGADEIWPLLFPFLDQATEGRGKFVLWPRNPEDWAQSYSGFFDMNSTTFNRFNLLSYGNGCRSELSEEQLARADVQHTAAVREHFASSEARGQLLEVDFTAPDAGQKLCAFVLGADDTTCASYTNIPKVEPSSLDLAWKEQYGEELMKNQFMEGMGNASAAGGFTCALRHECVPRR